MSVFLNTRQAAEYLGLQPSTLRAWRLRGTGPRYARLGRSPRARCAYRIADVEEWLSSRMFASTSEESIRKNKAMS